MRSLLKILLVCSVCAMPLMARSAPDTRQPLQLAQESGKSLSEAVEQVRRQYKNGRIISAETRIKGKREVHYIRVMVKGKVKTVPVNGRKLNRG